MKKKIHYADSPFNRYIDRLSLQTRHYGVPYFFYRSITARSSISHTLLCVFPLPPLGDLSAVQNLSIFTPCTCPYQHLALGCPALLPY